jgi:hypothetical protein
MLHIVVDQFLLIMKMPALILVNFLKLDDSHLISFVGVLFFLEEIVGYFQFRSGVSVVYLCALPWRIPVPRAGKFCSSALAGRRDRETPVGLREGVEISAVARSGGHPQWCAGVGDESVRFLMGRVASILLLG